MNKRVGEVTKLFVFCGRHKCMTTFTLQEIADLVSFNEEIRDGKLHFLCSIMEIVAFLMVWLHGTIVLVKLSKIFRNIFLGICFDSK